MSAEVLRAAARLMRERAEAATPGPWTGRSRATCYDFGCDDPQRPEDGRCVGVEISAPSQRSLLSGARHHDVERATADAEHVASWHPAVALAVADWLDALASRWQQTFTASEVGAAIITRQHHALIVARAYLGESA